MIMLFDDDDLMTMMQVADLVEERSNDTIGFFDESEGKFEEDWIKKI